MDPRAQNLEVLKLYIDTQRAALARTNQDLHRLRQLRDAASGGQAIQDDVETLKLSDHLDCAQGPPKDLDWSVYHNADPSLLKHLASTSRYIYEQRNVPHTTQRSELSDLQRLVKDARRTLVDPILAEYTCEPEPPEPPERVPLAISIPKPHHNKRGKNGLFVSRRRASTTDGDSMSVDGDSATMMDVDDIDTPPTSVKSRSTPPPPPAPPSLSIAQSKPIRNRKPSTRMQESEQHESDARARKLSDNVAPAPANPPNKRKRSPSTRAVEAAHQTDGPPAKRRARASVTSKVAEKAPRYPGVLVSTPVAASLVPTPPVVPVPRAPQARAKKSNTHGLAWSQEEIELLDRLIVQFPTSTPQRYKIISEAMDGKRSIVQVASRLQYYERKRRLSKMA